jgi:protein O-mannosyl-transferase
MKKHTDSLLFISLWVITFLIWQDCQSLGWLNWDDPEYALQNPWLEKLSGIWSIFYMGNYHPITLLSLGMDYLLWSKTPWGWHLTNLIFHCFNTSILFLLARKLGASSWVSLITAVCWTSLPVLTEAIAWVSSRKDLLYSFFALLSLLSFSKFAQSQTVNKNTYYFISLSLFLFACLSKAMAVMIPFWIILLFYRKEILSKEYQKVIKPVIPFFLISVLTGILAILAQQDAGAVQQSLGMIKQPALASISIGQLFQHTLIPFNLSPFYPYPQEEQFWMQALISILLLVGLLLGAFKLYSSRPGLLIGIMLFLSAALPVSQILPVGIALTADRYAYLASAGLLLVGIPEIFRGVSKPWMIGIPLSCVSLLGIFTIQKQIPVWRSGISVFKAVVTIHPQAAFAWSNLGNAYAEQKDLIQAENAFRKSIQADSSYWIGYQNLSAILYEKGAYQECKQLTLLLTKKNPEQVQGQLMLLRLSCQTGCDAQSYQKLVRLIQVHPKIAEGWVLLGEHFRNKKQYEEAETGFRIAVLLQPSNRNYQINHALMQAETGGAKEAIRTLSTFSQADPNDAILWANLAWVQFLGQELGAAAHSNSQALRLAPQVPMLWANQGLYLCKSSNYNEATLAFQKFLALNPDSTSVQQAIKDLKNAGVPSDSIQLYLPELK